MPCRMCSAYLKGPTAPANIKDIATAGLKSPPLIRKNTQTLTSREKPKASAMNINALMLGELAVSAVLVVELAICVAKKAMKRKKYVPVNSPRNLWETG